MTRRIAQTAIETINTSQLSSPEIPPSLSNEISINDGSPENPVRANDQDIDGDFEKVEIRDSVIDTGHSESRVVPSAVPHEGKPHQGVGNYKPPSVEQASAEQASVPHEGKPYQSVGNYKPPSVEQASAEQASAKQASVKQSTQPQSSEGPVGSSNFWDMSGFGSDNREYGPGTENQTQTPHHHRGQNTSGDSGEHRIYQTMKSWGEKGLGRLRSGPSAPPPPPPPDVFIAIMGKTGTGKTSFINAATRGSLKVGHSLQACTQKIQIAETNINGRKVIFIDTPGFDDTNRSDVDILGEITAYLQASDSNDLKLSGIIYLHKITDTRMEGSTMKNIRMFRKLCGEGNFHNVILCTTGWDLVDPGLGEERERELGETDNFWGAMVKKGARTKRHNYGNPTSAEQIATELVGKAPVVLQIQEELKKSPLLTDTSAGRLIQEEMEKLKIDHQKEIKALKDDIEEARRSNSHEEIEQMKKEYENEIRGLRKAHEELEKLRSADRDAMQKLIDELRDEMNKSRGGGGCIIC